MRRRNSVGGLVYAEQCKHHGRVLVLQSVIVDRAFEANASEDVGGGGVVVAPCAPNDEVEIVKGADLNQCFKGFHFDGAEYARIY